MIEPERVRNPLRATASRTSSFVKRPVANSSKALVTSAARSGVVHALLPVDEFPDASRTGGRERRPKAGWLRSRKSMRAERLLRGGRGRQGPGSGAHTGRSYWVGSVAYRATKATPLKIRSHRTRSRQPASKLLVSTDSHLCEAGKLSRLSSDRLSRAIHEIDGDAWQSQEISRE